VKLPCSFPNSGNQLSSTPPLKWIHNHRNAPLPAGDDSVTSSLYSIRRPPGDLRNSRGQHLSLLLTSLAWLVFARGCFLAPRAAARAIDCAPASPSAKRGSAAHSARGLSMARRRKIIRTRVSDLSAASHVRRAEWPRNRAGACEAGATVYCTGRSTRAKKQRARNQPSQARQQQRRCCPRTITQIARRRSKRQRLVTARGGKGIAVGCGSLGAGESREADFPNSKRAGKASRARKRTFRKAPSTNSGKTFWQVDLKTRICSVSQRSAHARHHQPLSRRHC